MNFDVSTIMKAISLFGAATDAGKKIYDAFVPLLTGASQEELQSQYAKAIEASDADHAELQDELKR